MDNRLVDITSQGRPHFDMALDIVFSNASTGVAVAVAMHPDVGMVLFCREKQGTFRALTVYDKSVPSTDDTRKAAVAKSEKGAVPIVALPYPLNRDAARDFVWHWLQTVKRGARPAGDVESSPGWRVYNEAWGQIAGHHEAFVAIQPVWAMAGK